MSRGYLADLFGDAVRLAEIGPPPRGSYDAWEAWLERCRDAGLAAVNDRGDLVGPFGYALLRRWRWLQDARNMGLPCEIAEQAFDAEVEREREANARLMRESEKQRARAMKERDRARKSYDRTGDSVRSSGALGF